jgi:hypothetical protein
MREAVPLSLFNALLEAACPLVGVGRRKGVLVLEGELITEPEGGRAIAHRRDLVVVVGGAVHLHLRGEAGSLGEGVELLESGVVEGGAVGLLVLGGLRHQ